MKAHKANSTQWRIDVMTVLGLPYTHDTTGKMVYRGDLLGYKTFVDLLVSERIKLGIPTF